MLLLILAATLAVSTASPHYIAMPADQIAFVDLRALHIRTPRHVRMPRQNLEPPPLPEALYQKQEYLPAYQPQLNDYQVREQGQYQVQDPGQTFQAIPIPVQRYAPIPINLAPQAQQQAPAAPAAEDTADAASAADTRPPDFGEYVDFGAHTGDNGAFGWYADYPINAYESHRK